MILAIANTASKHNGIFLSHRSHQTTFIFCIWRDYIGWLFNALCHFCQFGMSSSNWETNFYWKQSPYLPSMSGAKQSSVLSIHFALHVVPGLNTSCVEWCCRSTGSLILKTRETIEMELKLNIKEKPKSTEADVARYISWRQSSLLASWNLFHFSFISIVYAP